MTDSHTEAREVELIDYLDVVWRWKWLIAIVIGACVLGAAAFMPRTYGVRASIDVGDLSEEREKDVERLVGRLNGRTLTGGANSSAGVATLTAEFKKPSLIVLHTDAQSPAEAAKSLEGVVSEVIGAVNKLLAAQELQYEATQRYVDQLRRSLDDLQRAQEQALRRSSDPVWVLVFARLSEEIVEKQKALVEAERRLALQPAVRRSARVAGAPVGESGPLRPRIRRNLALGGAVGILSSVLLAFFLDYLGKARARRHGSMAKALGVHPEA